MTVSVIIPVYNGQSTIARCIRSVLKQTYAGLTEILVVDDGSTDTTEKIIRELAFEDARIKYLKKTNGGVSDARNYGLALAQGDYIMFVDSDDEIKPELIEKTVLADKHAELVIAGVELHQDSGTSILMHAGSYSAQETISLYGTAIPSLLLNGPCSKLFQRNIIETNKLAFNKSISLGEDTLFVFQYLRYCKRVFFINESGYIYYQMGTASLMTKFRENGYENAKLVYGMLLEETKAICSGAIPINMKKAYQRVLLTYIRKAIYHKNKMSKSKIENIVNDYVSDQIVQDSISEAKGTNYFQRIINKLTERKEVQPLVKLLMIHVKIRGV